MKRIQRLSVLILIVLFLGTINWAVLNDHYILKSVIKPTSSIIIQNEFHPPLFINGNNEFYLTAIKEGWKGNGSFSSPYIIDSLTITYYYGRLLIDIQNTNVYFKISNCVLTLGFHGIFLKNVTNGIITNNLISNNTHGIFLIESNNNTLVGNTIISNENNGIHLIFSENNTLISNTLINNGNIGIYLEASIYNSVLDNILINNSFQVWRYITPYAMPKVKYFQLLEVVNNSVNGKPIIYWQNRTGETIPSGAGQIFLINCTSIKVENQDFSRNTGGIVAVFSSDIQISYNTFSDATRIHFQEVINSSISFNTIITSNDEGSSLFNSQNCTVSNNTISNNGHGLYLESSTNNNYIYYNNIIFNTNQAFDNGNNHWNNSHQEGNYWSDYKGVDNGAGARIKGDGIGDTNIPHLGLDTFPFVNKSGWLFPGTSILYDPGEVDSDGQYMISWKKNVRTAGYILKECINNTFENSTIVYNGPNL